MVDCPLYLPEMVFFLLGAEGDNLPKRFLKDIGVETRIPEYHCIEPCLRLQ